MALRHGGVRPTFLTDNNSFRFDKVEFHRQTLAGDVPQGSVTGSIIIYYIYI